MSPRQPILRFCVILLIAVALLGIGTRPVFSADEVDDGVITVDSFLDIGDNIDDSVCSAGDPVGGPCTLRAAIYEANQNVALRNIVIKLPAGEYELTIPPDLLSANTNHTGDLKIGPFSSPTANSITIEPLGVGPVVIKSMIEDRILTVGENATVFIKNLTMRNGRVLIDSNNTNGGGAIHNSGSLSLDGVSLLNNSVSCRSTCTSTAAYISGGAIYNFGSLRLNNSTLDGNIAYRGSAIFNTGDVPTNSNLSILYSTISNNQNWGEATIVNYTYLTIINSTFSGNYSSDPGLTVTGIVNYGLINMQSSTMANKGWTGGIFNGHDSAFTGQVNLQDIIFKAEPGRSNCNIMTDSIWTSLGYNISDDDSCQLNPTLGDLPSVDPQLGGFGNWGGLTKTYMLNLNSPALNHRPSSCDTVLFPILDDQRHWPRNDGNCDTGAYEFSPFFLYLPFMTR